MKEKNKRILVLGYFGYQTNQLDGQTIKTRNVYELLNKYAEKDSKLSCFDTQDFRYNKGALLKMFKQLCGCDTLIYLPAQNNLTYIFPLVYILSLIRRFNILYIGIGGWLSVFLKKRSFHRFMLSRIRGIFLENNAVCDELRNVYRFRNVIVLPNFRLHNFIPIRKDEDGIFRLVFMSRIVMEKGLDIIFQVAKLLREQSYSDKIQIDFYGQIAEKDKDYFEEQISSNSSLHYKGALQPENVYAVLSKYDLLILPTRYPGEGFPGAILDAYISGIPVLVSNWKYNCEFVKDGVTGYVCDCFNSKSYLERIERLYKNPLLLSDFKNAAFKESKKYTALEVWKVLKLYLK